MHPSTFANRKSTVKKSTKAARSSRCHNLTVEERREVLARDPDVLKFEESSVCCRYCQRPISLDRRGHSAYYLGFWTKHKVTKTCKLNKTLYLNTARREGPETVNAAELLIKLRL
ncbi:hypothetical protein BJ912DRAFT_1145037 [Pholiota molesta]|nr:hypothetical protein BJ912DRAFT_1145037 [Pholiota molesta]